jgi:tRNA A-37 threonylcarbamoyl transferase component Bud32
VWDKDRDLKRTHSMPPENAASGGAWSAVADSSTGDPQSTDPTLTRDPLRSGLGTKSVLTPGECPDENLLVELAEGKLAGPARAAIDRHLDTCAECSRLVIELAKLAQPVRNAPKRYQVIRQLGAGAMGVVWEAEDSHLHRRVALKFVKPEGVDDKALRKRLLREARALAQVRHPNVMAVYDAGEADEEICLVLELVNGATARVWRSAKPRTTAEIVAVWRQAAAGLMAVHRAGIVHRDIKPDNVFVADDGRVLIGDFGLARGGDLGQTTTTLTVSGAVIGTPLYMSPEQLHGATATIKSDQFALAASIWEGVLDERPFRGTTIAAIVLAMQKVPEIPKTATPEQRRVLAILQKALDPDPSKRFDDIDGLIAALAEPVQRTGKAAIWIGIGAVVLAVAGTVAVLAATRQPKGPITQPAVGSGSSAAEPPQPITPTRVEVPPEPTGPKPTETLPVKTRRGAGPRDHKGQVRRSEKPTPVAKADAGSAAGSGSARPVSTAGSENTYTHLMMRAADRLNFGDGAGCLALLANVPDLPDDELRRVELVKANCRMATGDCVGAAAVIEATGKKLGWDANQIKTTTESADKAYCPIDAPPQTRWPERAQYRLQVAAGLGRSCKVILEIIAKHGIVLPEPKNSWFLETQCLVNANDCAGAKARYLAQLVPKNADPSNLPKIEADTAASFHSTFKKCPP